MTKFNTFVQIRSIGLGMSFDVTTPFGVDPFRDRIAIDSNTGHVFLVTLDHHEELIILSSGSRGT